MICIIRQENLPIGRCILTQGCSLKTTFSPFPSSKDNKCTFLFHHQSIWPFNKELKCNCNAVPISKSQNFQKKKTKNLAVQSNLKFSSLLKLAIRWQKQKQKSHMFLFEFKYKMENKKQNGKIIIIIKLFVNTLVWLLPHERISTYISVIRIYCCCYSSHTSSLITHGYPFLAGSGIQDTHTHACIHFCIHSFIHPFIYILYLYVMYTYLIIVMAFYISLYWNETDTWLKKNKNKRKKKTTKTHHSHFIKQSYHHNTIKIQKRQQCTMQVLNKSFPVCADIIWILLHFSLSLFLVRIFLFLYFISSISNKIISFEIF